MATALQSICIHLIVFPLHPYWTNDAPSHHQVDVSATYIHNQPQLYVSQFPSNYHRELDESKISSHSTEYMKNQLHCTPKRKSGENQFYAQFSSVQKVLKLIVDARNKVTIIRIVYLTGFLNDIRSAA